MTFVVWKGRGHLHAAFGLARRLQHLGRKVRFVGGLDCQPMVAAAGFEFHPCEALRTLRAPYGIDHRPATLLRSGSLDAAARKIRAGRREVRAFRRALPSIQRSIEALAQGRGAQCFVFDPFLLPYAIPLMAMGVPVAALSTKPFATFDPLVPPYTRPARPGGLFFKARVRVLWLAQHLLYRSWAAWEWLLAGATYADLVMDLARQCGLASDNLWKPRPILFDARLQNCPEWVLHAREYDFPRQDQTSPDVFYLGPCVDHDRPEQSSVIVQNQKRLIFASLSTVQDPSRRGRRRDLLRSLLELAKAHPDHDYVISAGRQASEVAPADLPDNVQLVSSAPAIEVLRRADALICQAGANLVKEAIWHGVPMVLLPDSADQPGNAARVTYHGLGEAFHHQPTAAQLGAALARVVHDKRIALAMTRMRAAFLRYDETHQSISTALAALEGMRLQA